MTCHTDPSTSEDGQKPERESAAEYASDSATSAEIGTDSMSSALPSNAAEGEVVDASTAEENSEPTGPLILDGWSCENFARKTGHAVGRSATHMGSDFQIMRVVVTAGETGDSDPERIPESVLAWLMKPELKEKPDGTD